jgi:hypothetical protein
LNFLCQQGSSSIKNILSNFNLWIFEPPQPISSHFLGAPISSSHCYYFLDFFLFLVRIFFFYFGREKVNLGNNSEISYEKYIKKEKKICWRVDSTCQHVIDFFAFKWHIRQSTVRFLGMVRFISATSPFHGNACGNLVPVWCWWAFLLSLFSLHLDFCLWHFKISNQPFDLFFLHIWSLFF